jgi:catechol 2,3-dioxygenase-like lactoylglutathione lyase family enzyme
MLAEARVEAAVPTSKLSRGREFYEGLLGLEPAGAHTPNVDVIYECAGGTRLLVYEHPGTVRPARTAAHFVVDDVPATVRELRGRGLRFDDYDLPELKTVDGVATVGELRFAWFRDPDNNVIGIHD